MGLNKEVRDFFKGRINRVLNERLERITEPINDEDLQASALSMFCSKHGIEGIPARWEKFEAKEKKLEAEKRELQNEIATAFGEAKVDINTYSYSRTHYDFSTLKSKALCLFKDDAMLELYPEIVPQIEKIALIKEDVQGAVLLATTENKLVDMLTRLLNNYGGEIKELLAMIPKN